MSLIPYAQQLNIEVEVLSRGPIPEHQLEHAVAAAEAAVLDNFKVQHTEDAFLIQAQAKITPLVSLDDARMAIEEAAG